MRADRLLDRRALLAGAASLVATGLSPAHSQAAGSADNARALLRNGLTIDMHSHAGRYSRPRAAFEPVAGPMREGGMNVVCLDMVADSPVTKIGGDGRIFPVREPQPGELAEHGRVVFGRILALAEQASLAVVRDSATLVAARDRPSIIVAAEGADFLEGSLDRLDEAQARYGLRHLQLTHYRVNELGDNQTSPPKHDGLTAFGADVVRACNRKGIVVDVAHSSFAAAKRAASVTTKPLILSHTSLSPRPREGSRLITSDHARAIAETGGVIGIWPPRSVFHDLAGFAHGFVAMVEIVGIDHVGLGTDFDGIPGGSVFSGYAALPDLAAELLTAGFGPGDLAKLLGGNYARVFAATVG